MWSAISFDIGDLLGITINLGIFGGFKLYKIFIEIKYIELISNVKIELEKSLSNYEENINAKWNKKTYEWLVTFSNK